MIIKNYSDFSTEKNKETVLRIIDKGIDAVLPENVIHKNVTLKDGILELKDQAFDLNKFKNVFLIGMGKASGAMAEELQKILKGRITKGYVNSTENKKLGNTTINKARHPIPDENGLKGVKEILKIVSNLKEDDLVVCLISGGGSAMAPAPQKGISLEELKEMNKVLVRSGAKIQEINIVRKHVSAIKGGRLAERIYPATIVSLIISDVIGDDLDSIASGPTAPDNSTLKDALNVLEKYDLIKDIPKSVLNYLKKGKETPKHGDKIFEKVHNLVIANNLTALNAMKEEAKKQGFKAEIINQSLTGEARKVGKYVSNEMKKASKNQALIFGGETTVTVKGSGMGGRNQELILALVEEIQGSNITIAAAGTDGSDFIGVAGAVTDGNSYSKARNLNLNIKEFLENNDSYNFFKKTKDLIITGVTGTNVCDVIIGIKQ